VFTIGNGANDVTGGAATTTFKVAGPGAILLGNSSDYAGNWQLQGGTTQLGAAAALSSTPARTIEIQPGATLAGKMSGSNAFTANPINIVGTGSYSVLSSDRSGGAGAGVNYTFGPVTIAAGASLAATTGGNVNSGTGGIIVGITTF